MSDKSDAILAGASKGRTVFAITPNDSTDLVIAAKGIAFSAAGALKITDMDGNAVTIPSGVLGAGVIHTFGIKRVWSTGTTATNIWGFA